LVGSLQCQEYLAQKPVTINSTFSGEVGPELIDFLNGAMQLPAWLRIKPMDFQDSTLTFSNGKNPRITASMALQDDLDVSLAATLEDESLSIGSLKLEDRQSSCSLTAAKENGKLSLTFDGSLYESTMKKLVDISWLNGGSIDGQAKVSVNLIKHDDFSGEGELVGKRLALDIGRAMPFTINRIVVKAELDRIMIPEAQVHWLDSTLDLSATAEPGFKSRPTLAIEISADAIDADRIMHIIYGEDGPGNTESADRTLSLPFRGKVELKFDSLNAMGFVIQPFRAGIRVDDEFLIRLDEAQICGLPVEGRAELVQRDLRYQLHYGATGLKLENVTNCIFGKHLKADGRLDLSGQLAGSVRSGDLSQGMSGKLDVRVTDGHVYRNIVLLNLLKFLNISQVLSGEISAEKMMEKGLGFGQIQSSVKLSKEKIHYETLAMDAEEFKVSGSGEIDLVEKRLDFTLLVAPLKTSSDLLEHLPLIGDIAETLETIPLSLKGSFEDIHLFPLAPSAVEQELISIMTDTLGIPVKLVHFDHFNKNKDEGGISPAN
jgi:hypothetical protein